MSLTQYAEAELSIAACIKGGPSSGSASSWVNLSHEMLEAFDAKTQHRWTMPWWTMPWWTIVRRYANIRGCQHNVNCKCQRPQLCWIVLLQSIDQLGVRGPGHLSPFEVSVCEGDALQQCCGRWLLVLLPMRCLFVTQHEKGSLAMLNTWRNCTRGMRKQLDTNLERQAGIAIHFCKVSGVS